MQAQLSHREVHSLFVAAVDEQLGLPEVQRFEHHLQGCADCRAGWNRYAQTVQRVRELPRERAPEALASLIARRLKRKRPLLQRTLSQANHRVPVEIIVPLLLAVVVAVLILLWAV